MELVTEVPPHIAEKSVVETRSVANVKAIINLVHDLTIPKEKFLKDGFLLVVRTFESHLHCMMISDVVDLRKWSSFRFKILHFL